VAATDQSQENRRTPPRRDLGAMRTIMAADRTLMAWIRTALSLLSFGFTIYKILQEVEKSVSLPQQESPRNIGVILAVAGTVAMVMGTIEYWLTLHELQQDHHFWHFRPALIMALLMCISGIILIFGILARLF
jgi:putative membrane protein